MTVQTRTLWDRVLCFITQSDLDDAHRCRLQSFDKLVEDTRSRSRPRSYEEKVADAKADALNILKP